MIRAKLATSCVVQPSCDSQPELDLVRALNCVSAAVLFTDSAVEPAPVALSAALQRLGSDPRIGAMGGRLVRARMARLESAGGIVSRNGMAHSYLRDASAPEANLVRDVDFCSAASAGDSRQRPARCTISALYRQ